MSGVYSAIISTRVNNGHGTSVGEATVRQCAMTVRPCATTIGPCAVTVRPCAVIRDIGRSYSAASPLRLYLEKIQPVRRLTLTISQSVSQSVRLIIGLLIPN